MKNSGPPKNCYKTRMKNLGILLIGLSTSAYAGLYGEVFPRYYEYCAGTMLHYQKDYFNGAKGGAGGHAYVYLQGICKDYSKPYPQVKVCDKSDDHEGVGISLDSDYKNVAWIAVPGRELIHFGNKEQGSVISKSDVDELIQKSIDLEIFKNVELKNYPQNLLPEEKERYTALFSIGTDIAINWARELRCVKTPVSEDRLKDAVTFLNETNNKYFLEGKEYKWSMLANNCTHLSINIGHELGVNPSIATDRSFLKQLGNIAIPANHYLYLMDKVVMNKKVDKRKTYTPNQFGAIASKFQAFPNNEMFITEDLKSFTLRPRKNIKRILSTAKSYDSFLKRKEFTDLRENALYWSKLYSDKDDSQKLNEVLNFLNY